MPTIHVIDLARLVKRIVNKRPNEYYIFAVDRTKKPTMKNIVEAISNGIGTGKSRSVNIQEAINDDWAAYYLNIKMRTSAVFKDEEPPEDAEDPEEAAKKLRFPWHCENGIPDNVRKLNEEFNQFRGLNPVKIFITGPPASGKSHYADLLSKYYNIPHVTVQDAVALAATVQGEMGEELRAKIEEAKDAMMEEAEKTKKKGQEVTRD